MAPVTLHVGKPSDSEGLVTEAWAEGFMVGGLIVMTGVAIANMRKKVLLHRLIVLEVGLQTYVAQSMKHLLTTSSAHLRNVPWHFHFYQ